MEFKRLFSPIKINQVEIRNRVVMPAFGLFYSEDRRCNSRVIEFYRERARGGCGLIIVGGVGIDFIGGGPMMLGIDDDSFIPGYERLAEAVHDEGAKLFLQLFHAGRYQFSFLIGQKSVGPSAVRSRYTKEEPRALTKDEIVEIEDKFADAALRAKKAGADGVELIGSAGYLINQFLSPITNLRDDDYGGSFEKRARFVLETIEKIRERVGSDFIVSMRIGGNDFIPGGNTNEEMSEYARMFVGKGLDCINVTGGWHETLVPQLPMMVPAGSYTYLALGVKRKVNVPVFCSNRITTPEQAEKLLEEGWADLVSVGRAQIADPEWANKAKEGRSDEIRPCVGCMQGCMDRLFSGRSVTCLSNPRAGYEQVRKLLPVSSAKKVLVVGGGVAGIEAALTAKARGHDVELWEKSDKLGGQLILAGAVPGRGDFLRLLDFYKREIKRLKLKVKLCKEATLSKVLRAGFDRIIVATGAEPLIPDIPGIGLPNVFTAWQVLLGEAELGRKVLVLGGGAVGVETAIYIASQGTISGEVLKFLFVNNAESIEKLRELCNKGSREVVILEMLEKIGQDLGVATRWVLLQELRRLGVKVITSAKVIEIRQGEVIYSSPEGERSEVADSVVIAFGARSSNKLSLSLRKKGIVFEEAGDCISPRKIMEAIEEGFLRGNQV